MNFAASCHTNYATRQICITCLTNSVNDYCTRRLFLLLPSPCSWLLVTHSSREILWSRIQRKFGTVLFVKRQKILFLNLRLFTYMKFIIRLKWIQFLVDNSFEQSKIENKSLNSIDILLLFIILYPSFINVNFINNQLFIKFTSNNLITWSFD